MIWSQLIIIQSKHLVLMFNLFSWFFNDQANMQSVYAIQVYTTCSVHSFFSLFALSLSVGTNNPLRTGLCPQIIIVGLLKKKETSSFSLFSLEWLTK